MRAILLVLALVFAAAPALARAPDVVLKGVVTGADNLGYRELPFVVPQGVGRITVTFAYTGHEQHTALDLGLFDPERFRGWSGGDKPGFTLSDTDATPSYLPGPIPAGTWTLILGIPNIRKDATSNYEADVFFDKPGAAPAVSAFSDAPLRAGPAWFRGDLHMHTAQSDGTCLSQSGRKVPCPLFKTVEAAVARGLDFIAITDHNTISHFNDERELQPYFDKLLLIPGREITTYRGHANVFGPTAFIDFRLGTPHVPDFNAMLARVEALGGLIAINHPNLPNGEVCMGCGWIVPDTDYSRVQAVEILNGGAMAIVGGAAETPLSGIPFWEALLDKGHRLIAIGGSDNHNGPSDKPPLVGLPVTAVYADNLSDRAILAAIRAGHVFVDAGGSTTRLLELTAKSSQGRAATGDLLRARPGERVTFTVHVAGAAGASVSLIEDGRKIAPLASPAIAGGDETKIFTVAFDGKRHWLRAELRDAGGKLLTVGNPIYVDW